MINSANNELLQFYVIIMILFKLHKPHSTDLQLRKITIGNAQKNAPF